MSLRLNMAVSFRSNWNEEVLVFEGGGGGGESEYPKKNLSEQGREQTRNRQPTYGVDPRIAEPGPHWWEVSAVTTATAPPLLFSVGYRRL